MVTEETSMSTPINNFQDILDALERDPALRDTLRRHILTEELLQLPARFVELQEQVARTQTTVDELQAGQTRLKQDVGELKTTVGELQAGQARLEQDVGELKQDVGELKAGQTRLEGNMERVSGRLSNLTGDNYESHVAGYVHRFLRRNLNIHASVFATQREKAKLTALLDLAESEGRIEPDETDDLDRTDLVLTINNSEDYLVAEISTTVQQSDINRAASRANLLAKATRQNVTPLAIGTREEPGLNRAEVQVLIIPEPGEQQNQDA